MRADAYPLNVVLGERQQWVVPVYQRHYEWETGDDRQLPKLWEDLRDETLDRLEGRTVYPHYFGAIIYSEPVNQPYGAVRKRFLVDGQQRITTFQLVLTALRETARKHKVDRLVDVLSTYLFNESSASMSEPERERFKLWPSAYDRKLFQDIAEHTPTKLRSIQPKLFYKNGNLNKSGAPNLVLAYFYLLEVFDQFVSERLRDEGETADQVLEALLGSFLEGFQIVVIQLDATDDAQEIFASLNGLGKPLSPFDLIRNYVFHRARKLGEDDEKLFDDRWKVFEQPFWTQLVRQGRFKRARADHLIAHAVVAETAQEVNVGKIATEYQRFSRERSFSTVAEELDVLLAHASTYRDMETQNLEGPLGRLSRVLRTWDMSTFHPVVFAINAKEMDEEERADLFMLLEAYIVRRELCGLSTKNYNKVAIGLVARIRENDAPFQSAKEYLFQLAGDASRMPSDAELKDKIARHKAYAAIPTPRLSYILQLLEYAHRDRFDEVTILGGNLTIEHVLPRRWAANWPLPGGSVAPCETTFEAINAKIELSDETKALMEARQSWVDTLGNLTILTEALNPSIGNGAWVKKREKIGKSLLAINRAIAEEPEWGEDQIEQRAASLADLASVVWRS